MDFFLDVGMIGEEPSAVGQSVGRRLEAAEQKDPGVGHNLLVAQEILASGGIGDGRFRHGAVAVATLLRDPRLVLILCRVEEQLEHIVGLAAAGTPLIDGLLNTLDNGFRELAHGGEDATDDGQHGFDDREVDGQVDDEIVGRRLHKLAQTVEERVVRIALAVDRRIESALADYLTR